MINYDSIISVFNEKGTLLKWLKKVEKALKESVLTNVEVLQGESNSFAFKFTFQDNTSVTTDYVTIEPNITATLLQNYIEGSNTVVVDLNELQNKLIVKLDEEYKNTLATKSEVATKQDIITDSADIVKQGTGLVFSNSAKAEIASKQNNIVDSEEIVKHTGENDKLYLNNNISNKINNSMQLPTTAPTVIELVGIDTNKSQTNIGIGSGLSLENGTLKATGGGGGSYFEAFTSSAVILNLSGSDYTLSDFKVHNAITNSLLDITTNRKEGNFDYIVFLNNKTLGSGQITNNGNLDLLVITINDSTILSKNESINLPDLSSAPCIVKFIRKNSEKGDASVTFNLTVLD